MMFYPWYFHGCVLDIFNYILLFSFKEIVFCVCMHNVLQEVTGLEDESECTAILERHAWIIEVSKRSLPLNPLITGYAMVISMFRPFVGGCARYTKHG